MKTIAIPKGSRLQNKGDINSKVYMVDSGLLRAYSIDEKGKEHIFLFAPEGWIVADNVDSETPCELYIDALEDATVSVFSKDTGQDRLDSNQILRRLGVLQKRVIMLMSATALERYQHFVETYPKITQRVPQRMIASYLGITPEALSKVKSEWVSNR